MKARLKAALVWAALVCVIAGAAAYLLQVDFVMAAIFSAVALTVNGMIARREDRGTFND